MAALQPSEAQIGGFTAAEGPFLIDSAEDLNLRSESLGRDWVSDFVGSLQVLSAANPAANGLVLASGQSPLGSLHASIPRDKYGSIQGGFGIPMPAQPGASTLVAPGDITSFESLRFFACYAPSTLPNLKFQVLLECYPQNPDGTHPTIFWNYTPPAGVGFGAVSVLLNNNAGILNNPASRTASELMTKTRFLYFLNFASPVDPGANLDVWVDDLQLLGPESPTTAATSGKWYLYR